MHCQAHEQLELVVLAQTGTGRLDPVEHENFNNKLVDLQFCLTKHMTKPLYERCMGSYY